jgi:GTP-binding protein YchF
MKLGIVGLPNIGKSTLFNALTKAGAESANYPFCTIEPNNGVVAVPDARLNVLQKLYNARKLVPAFIEFVDIAGLVKGASKGEGLGNKFLSHIREVDAIVHVIRCFEDPDVIHVDGDVDPGRDITTINMELILADMESVEKRLEKLNKQVRANNDKQAKQDLELMDRVMAHLSAEKMVRTMTDDDEEMKRLHEFGLLTMKKTIYACNVSEDLLSSGDSDSHPAVKQVHEIAAGEGSGVVVISAKVEEEIAQLDESEKGEFLEALGLEQAGLDRLIQASYSLLGLFSYLTAGEKEVRAWTIPVGTRAPQAAGKIHTDFEKGFIRAEIVAYDDLIEFGSLAAAREKGKVRVEGKEYVMQPEDVVLFRFNV